MYVRRNSDGKVPVKPDRTGKYLVAGATPNPVPPLFATGAEAGVWIGSGGRI
jgi:hypothetical protein